MDLKLLLMARIQTIDLSSMITFHAIFELSPAEGTSSCP